MAFRTWAKLLSATLGVGVLAGASQLGLAYGLGIVRLTRVVEVTARDQWTAQLAWIAWFPMVAAVAAALAGTALSHRWAPGFRGGAGTELAMAFAAAIGAAVVVPLTMQPARTAQIAGVNPVLVIAICAGLGALVGVFAAWAALAQAVARWSLVTMAIAIWVIAVVSVAPSLGPSDPLPAVRLGVFDAGFLSPAVTQRTALATMPALALLAGAALGWVARRRGLPTLTIALAGLPGPALLTIAYLIAGPGAGSDRYQVVPYWAAMTATGAGVLGSVLAAVLRRPPAPDDEDDDTPPTAGLPPLPKRTEQPESAIAAAAVPQTPPPADPPLRPSDTAVFDPPTVTRPGEDPGASPTPDFPPAPSPSGTNLSPAPPSGGTSATGPDFSSASRPGRTPATSADFASAPRPGGTPATGPDFSSAPRPGGKDATGRRPSVADAFTGRTGEFPTRRPGPPPAAPPPARGVALGDYAAQEPSSFDAFARGARNAGTATAEQDPYVPEPATRPLPPEALHAPTAEQPRPGRTGRSMRPFARGRADAAATAARHAPDPTIPQPRAAHAAEPLTPEPTAVSAPLPRPEPVNPLPPMTPAPRGATTPAQAGTASTQARTAPTQAGPAPTQARTAPTHAGPASAPAGPASTQAGPPQAGSPQAASAQEPPTAGRGRGKFGLRRRKDEEIVDWVSGLGK
ncbi:hypothetical protein [Pseudosporangium ferrugineum]|uniref:Uncharacterized protein n=1 Tax=Pseudosporangium ferrugineum TaxID=439699 RepID=A0A2T0RGJ2_9ACTN|nr:hypothetical protein [Pseudosporangium ferrugineum]PRY20324.1 hypothetical protein CLV70_12436 [Pseudosporangium ferrugineum]